VACPKAGTMDTRDRIPSAAIALKRIIPHMVKSDRQARELYNLGRWDFLDGRKPTEILPDDKTRLLRRVLCSIV
jgi:hypothetical protein